jgi:hypothetical protein
VSADVEGAVRTWLRAHPRITPVVGARVFFGLPTGTASCITFGQAGGGPDPIRPLTRPLLSFSCWAGHDSAGLTSGTKADAHAIRSALTDALMDLEDLPVDVNGVRLFDATVLSSSWQPDTSTRPTTPRYVVDAEFRALQLTS